MKKWIWGVVILVVLVLIFILTGPSKDTSVIKIGALLPMTGSGAIYGECQYNGALLAVEENNKITFGKKFELDLQDTKGDTKEGLSAYNLSKSKFESAIVAMSGVVLSLGSIADSDGKVLINIGAKSPKISSAGDYVFSVVQNSDGDESVFAKFVKDGLLIDNLALVYINNDYGIGTSGAFSNAFISYGGKVVAEEKYDSTTTDFKTLLSKIKQKNPKGIFVVGYKEQGILLKQAYDLGIRAQWLAPEPFASPDIIDLAGIGAEGVVYHIPNLDPNTEVEPTKSFFSNYKKRFNKEADFCSANSYDATRLLIEAISRVGNDGDKIKTYLYSIKNWESTTGKISFDENGDVSKDLIIMTVKGGKFVKF